MATTLTYGQAKGSVQDATLTFANGQTIAATAASTDILDFGSDYADGTAWGTGTPVYIDIVVMTAPAGTGVYTFTLRTDEAAPIDGSSLVVVSSAAIPAASLAKGDVVTLVVPENAEMDQYVGLYTTVSGTPSTDIVVDAFVRAG